MVKRRASRLFWPPFPQLPHQQVGDEVASLILSLFRRGRWSETPHVVCCFHAAGDACGFLKRTDRRGRSSGFPAVGIAESNHDALQMPDLAWHGTPVLVRAGGNQNWSRLRSLNINAIRILIHISKALASGLLETDGFAEEGKVGGWGKRRRRSQSFQRRPRRLSGKQRGAVQGGPSPVFVSGDE
jgi:hypothetical protein